MRGMSKAPPPLLFLDCPPTFVFAKLRANAMCATLGVCCASSPLCWRCCWCSVACSPSSWQRFAGGRQAGKESSRASTLARVKRGFEACNLSMSFRYSVWISECYQVSCIDEDFSFCLTSYKLPEDQCPEIRKL